MTIVVQCPQCTAEFRFKDEAADRLLACPHCSEPIQVPSEPNFDGTAMDQEYVFLDQKDDEAQRASLPPKVNEPDAEKAVPESQEKKDLRWAFFIGVSVLACVVIAFVLLDVYTKTLGNTDKDEIAKQKTDTDEKKDEAADAKDVVVQNRDPEIPGALSNAPKWMLTEKPFDVGKYFRLPATGKNAETLYLDALYEVSAAVSTCFPEDQRDERTSAVRKRARYFIEQYNQWKQNPSSIDTKTIEGVMRTYKKAFEKIEAAQQRPECVFRTSIDFSAETPHVRAAREFVSVFEFKMARQLFLEDARGATKSTAVVLRLIRDLRRRAIPSTELAASEMEAIAYRWVPWILMSPSIHVEDCDRLLKMLATHGSQTVDPLLEATKTDYCMARKVLHDVENKTGAFSDKTIREVYQQPNASIGMLMASFLYHASDQQVASRATQIDTALAEMSADDFKSEVALLDESYATLLGLKSRPYRERERVVGEVRMKLASESKLLGFAAGSLSEIARTSMHHETVRRGLICIIALKRWKLQYTDAPTNLAAIAKDAGLVITPIDPYSGGQFRLGANGNQSFVYSVGPNGIADQSNGSKTKSNRDDIVFRLYTRSTESSSTAPVDF